MFYLFFSTAFLDFPYKHTLDKLHIHYTRGFLYNQAGLIMSRESVHECERHHGGLMNCEASLVLKVPTETFIFLNIIYISQQAVL